MGVIYAPYDINNISLTELIRFLFCLLVVPEHETANLDAHARCARITLVFQRERTVRSTSRTTILFRVEDLEHPRLIRGHVTSIVPSLVRVLSHISNLVSWSEFPVGGILSSLLVGHILRDIAIFTCAWRGQVCDNSAEVVLVDGFKVTEGQWVSFHGVKYWLPDVHDGPSLLHATLRFLFREVEIQNLLGAAVRLVHVHESLCQVLALNTCIARSRSGLTAGLFFVTNSLSSLAAASVWASSNLWRRVMCEVICVWSPPELNESQHTGCGE